MILFPCAKINIGLRVLSKRDDGYHNISSVLYPVSSCSDILEITEQKHFLFESSGIDIPKGENLCEKAFYLLRKDFSFPNVHIHLHKQIPIGAGLGGGSADAAFTLKGVNELFELGISNKRLEEYALRLGADCPFFIDNTPKYVEGIGEKMISIDLDLSRFEIRLVNPEIYISTGEAYGRITPQIPKTNLLDLINQPMEHWKGKIKNDFEKNIFAKHSKLQSIKQQLYKDDAVYASMSGSGSTLYGFFVK